MQGFCSGATRLVDKIWGSLQLFINRGINSLKLKDVFNGCFLDSEDFFRAIIPLAELKKDNAVGILFNDFLQFVFQFHKGCRRQFTLKYGVLNPVQIGDQGLVHFGDPLFMNVIYSQVIHPVSFLFQQKAFQITTSNETVYKVFHPSNA